MAELRLSQTIEPPGLHLKLVVVLPVKLQQAALMVPLRVVVLQALGLQVVALPTHLQGAQVAARLSKVLVASLHKEVNLEAVAQAFLELLSHNQHRLNCLGVILQETRNVHHELQTY